MCPNRKYKASEKAENELTVAERKGSLGMDMYTLLYLKWINNKDLLYSMWNFVQCYLAAWMRGKLWREWICLAESFTVHLKLSTALLIDYTPIQNKKLKKKSSHPIRIKWYYIVVLIWFP